MHPIVKAYIEAGYTHESMLEAARLKGEAAYLQLLEAAGRQNSTAMVVVPGEPPGKSLCQFIRGIVPNRTKVIVVAQQGSLGPGQFERLLRAAMPDVESKLRVMDGGASIADAVTSAEANGHYSPSQSLEVLADPQLVRNFSQEVSDGSLGFDPTVIMATPSEIPSDDPNDVRKAVGSDDLAAMHRVLDPHLFSDAAGLQTYKDELRSGQALQREFLTDIAPSRDLGIKKLDAILRAEIGDVARDLEYLGSGRNGSAYRTPDGLILKVTTDPMEADSAARLRGLETEYIHRIHGVYFTADPHVWMILQEGGLEKLPPEHCEEFDVAMEAIEALGAGHALRKGDAEEVKEIMVRSGHHDLAVLVAEVLRKFDMGGMLREIAELGLTADFHSGNIMLREGRPVITDLGTPGDDPGAMSEALSPQGNTVYHGSHTPINALKTISGANMGTDFGPGMYFTTSPEDAKYYGHYVYQAEVSLRNPLVVGDQLTPEMQKLKAALRIDDEYMEQGGRDNPWHVLMGLVKMMVEIGEVSWTSVIKFIQKMGHDGILVQNSAIKSSPGGSHIKGDYLIVFDVSQVEHWRASGNDRPVNELVGAQAAPQAGPRSLMRGSNSSAWAGGKMVLSKPEQHVPEDDNETERDHALDQDIVGGGLDWGAGLNRRGY